MPETTKGDWQIGDSTRDGRTCCEVCGSLAIDFSGDDVDKCLICGHWRYRSEPSLFDEAVGS